MFPTALAAVHQIGRIDEYSRAAMVTVGVFDVTSIDSTINSTYIEDTTRSNVRRDDNEISVATQSRSNRLSSPDSSIRRNLYRIEMSIIFHWTTEFLIDD